MHASAVEEKRNALSKFVGFINGPVLGISKSGDSGLQRAAQNGPKRKHDLKFQEATAPDDLIIHVSGPIEGRRHGWALYLRSGLEAQLGAKKTFFLMKSSTFYAVILVKILALFWK